MEGNYNTFLEPSLSKEQARERIGLPTDKKVILIFGHIRKGKGIETAVKGFNLVKNKSDLLFMIAGKPMRGYDMDPIRRELAREDMKGHMVLRDHFIEDNLVESYYKSSDIMLIPYEHIYNSTVVRYAFSCAVPTVVSNLKEFSKFATHEENCLIFNIDLISTY